MTRPGVAAYGSWSSPITAAMGARAGVRLGATLPQGPATYWVEARPAEAGRSVVVRASPDGAAADLIPPGFNARTRVHEYGGGAWMVRGDVLVFSNFADQRLYRVDVRRPAADPLPITPEPTQPAGDRYADGRITPDGRLLVSVRERHQPEGVTNELVALPVDGSAEPWTLEGGRDFYSFPRPSPDGTRLAWTCWDFPNMPWDGTELWVAELSEDGRLSRPRRLAGGPEESVFQPQWSPQGVLHFVSDRTGWWNLYRERGEQVEALCPMEAEFGVAQWVFGLSTYAFLGDGDLACVYNRDGTDHLALIGGPEGAGALKDLDLPYTVVEFLASDGARLTFVGAGPEEAEAVVSLDVTSGSLEVVRPSRAAPVDARFVSHPQHVTFPTGSGLTAHAIYFPPANGAVSAPPGERPPLLVLSHGGPTSQTGTGLELDVQFWTSRGFAVADVNYGGSTGYGRAYRQRLAGAWGIVDTDDCISAARYLAAQGMVDGDRMAIRGGSAGGYTTLCALTFHDLFAAGASYFGVGDAEALARDTHKFESRYLDRLIGPYPAAAEVYRRRSPIHHVDRLSRPVILFQGLEDEVVPPSQAEEMVRALAARGIPHAYLSFPGEQHGFRKAENIERCLEAELYFYGKVLGFEPAGPIQPVPIANL